MIRVMSEDLDLTVFCADDELLIIQTGRIAESQFEIDLELGSRADRKIRAGDFFQIPGQFLCREPDNGFGIFRNQDPCPGFPVFSNGKCLTENG